MALYPRGPDGHRNRSRVFALYKELLDQLDQRFPHQVGDRALEASVIGSSCSASRRRANCTFETGQPMASASSARLA
jgi:hypothetical protein